MTRFERYPGPPSGGSSLYRVISPRRDALAWISIADKLRVAHYLVREVRDGDGWRDARPPDLAAGTYNRPWWPVRSEPPEGPIWSLQMRDPVELVFETPPAAITGRASITVDRHACEIAIQLRNHGDTAVGLADLVAWDGEVPTRLDPGIDLNVAPGSSASFLIRIASG